ncbi:MAG: hypothetical protein ACRC6R_07880 [Bacteroidales bacterium]
MIKRALFLLALAVGGTITLEAQSLDAGKQLFLKGEYDNARAIFEKHIKQRPNDASLNHWLGVCYFEAQERTLSEKYLKVGARRNIQESYRYLSMLYMQEYRFDEAKKAAATYSAFRNLNEAQRDDAAILQKKSEMGARMLNGVEDVVILDSMIVPRETFLKAYRLSEESGSLSPFNEFFPNQDRYFGAVYVNQRKDKVILSKKMESQDEAIFSASLNNDNTLSDITKLDEPISQESNNNNFPFLLSDGMTIYFSSDREESIGGLDIFVSRYNPGSGNYLKPENVGFPFNSPYNDYMMAIDELNGFGWFTTDRYQPEGSVIIYTFLYNETKRAINSEEDDYLRSRAAIRSIKESWESGADYSKEIARLKQVGAITKQKDDGFFFVVNNDIQYKRFEQFKNKQALELFKQSQALKNKLSAANNELDTLRRELASSTGSKRGANNSRIVQLEAQCSKMSAEIKIAEAQIRSLELSNVRGR